MNPSQSTFEYQKLNQLIHQIEIAMMTTVGPQGELQSRPMMVQEMDAEGYLWFFTSKEAGKVKAIENDARVNLAYASPKSSKFVSVCGTANLIEDEAKKNELWTPALKAWFPKDTQVSSLGLIRVQPDSAEYWDAPNGRMVQLFKIAKAAMSGHRPEMTAKEHGRIQLH